MYDENSSDNVALSGFAEKASEVLFLTTGTTDTYIDIDVSNKTANDRSIVYTVAATNLPTGSYTLQQNPLLAANQHNAKIKVTVNNNLLNAGGFDQYYLNLKLQSIGGTSINSDKTNHVVTFKLSCPKGNLSGNYNVDVYAFADQAPSHTVALVPVDGVENTYSITSSWGPTFVAWATGNSAYNNQYLYKGNIKINCDDTVTFIGKETGTWDTGGTGTYDPVTGVINIALSQGLFTGAFTTDLVFTKLP